MTSRIKAGPFDILCNDPMEAGRAKSYYTKEPGTLAWLEELQAGEVVYDVGANIGLYTLAAAAAVGPTGLVYAFEPHVINAASLIRNVRLNGFEDRVTILTCALGEAGGLQPFYYASKRAGTSGSQLGTPLPAPGAVELKSVVTLDGLMWKLEPPSHIKIDVDGLELRILRGARQVLGFYHQPRSIQVEAPPEDADAITALMQSYGYSKERIHYTSNGQQQIDQGADPATVIHNAIFRKAA